MIGEYQGSFLNSAIQALIAARLDGTSEMRIITRHLVPSFTSHIIASVTLAIPAMIIAETSLSFLGIGLRLLDIKRVPVASYLPGLVVAPVLVGLFAR